MEEQATKVVIEVCHNCKSHQWNTRHDEAKYNAFYKMMSQEIKRLCGQNCTIFKNQIPKEYMDFQCYSGLFGEDRSCDVIRMDPRLGAFQIFYKGFCLFSKLKNRVWPRINLVARKVANVVEKIQRNQDISNLLTSPKSVSDMSPRSTTLNRAQTASRLSREKQAYATVTRSKFVKSYAQGFYSPSGRMKNSSSRELTRSVKSASQTKKSCSTKDLRSENILTHESQEVKSKDGEEEEELQQANPLDIEDQGSITPKSIKQNQEPPETHISQKQVNRNRAAAQDFSINIIRSQDQQLFLFGKRKESQKPLPQIQHHQNQEVQDHKVPSHNTTALEPDVFDEELKVEPSTPKSTYRELQNVVEEVDYQGGYLTDEGSVEGQVHHQDDDTPQVNIYESGKQPLYYWGDSAPGGMPPTMHVVGEKEEEGSDSESGYSSPTPVELRVSESPDQGVLFNQIQLATKLQPIAMEREQTEEDEYEDASFEKEAH